MKTPHRFDNGKYSGLVIESSGDYQVTPKRLKLGCSSSDIPNRYQFLRFFFTVDADIEPHF